MIDFQNYHAIIAESFELARSTHVINTGTTGDTTTGRTMRCTEVADQPIPDGGSTAATR